MKELFSALRKRAIRRGFIGGDLFIVKFLTLYGTPLATKAHLLIISFISSAAHKIPHLFLIRNHNLLYFPVIPLLHQKPVEDRGYAFFYA